MGLFHVKLLNFVRVNVLSLDEVCKLASRLLVCSKKPFSGLFSSSSRKMLLKCKFSAWYHSHILSCNWKVFLSRILQFMVWPRGSMFFASLFNGKEDLLGIFRERGLLWKSKKQQHAQVFENLQGANIESCHSPFCPMLKCWQKILLQSKTAF